MRLTGCALGRAVLIQLGDGVGPCLGPSPGPVLGGFIRLPCVGAYITDILRDTNELPECLEIGWFYIFLLVS